MPPADALLAITIEPTAHGAMRRLLLRCAHGTTSLHLPITADRAVERTLTALATLQHYSTTGCSCTRRD